MSTDLGNLNGVVKLKESKYEDLINNPTTSSPTYSNTQMYLIEGAPYKRFWNNPNPNSIFNEQDIYLYGDAGMILNDDYISNYKYIIIYVAYTYSSSYATMQWKFVNPFYKGIEPSWSNRKMFYVSVISPTGYTSQRQIKMNTPTILHVYPGYYCSASATSYTQSNYYCIPLEVWGTNSL